MALHPAICSSKSPVRFLLPHTQCGSKLYHVFPNRKLKCTQLPASTLVHGPTTLLLELFLASPLVSPFPRPSTFSFPESSQRYKNIIWIIVVPLLETCHCFLSALKQNQDVFLTASYKTKLCKGWLLVSSPISFLSSLGLCTCFVSILSIYLALLASGPSCSTPSPGSLSHPPLCLDCSPHPWVLNDLSSPQTGLPWLPSLIRSPLPGPPPHLCTHLFLSCCLLVLYLFSSLIY